MIEEILRGLYRVVVPLPGNPLREVNSYVFTSTNRNLIVDTGMNRPECREVVEAGLEEIGVDLDRTDFVATHFHADHQGLIADLLRNGSRAFMGELDALAMKADFDPWSESGPWPSTRAAVAFPPTRCGPRWRTIRDSNTALRRSWTTSRWWTADFLFDRRHIQALTNTPWDWSAFK